MLSVVFGLQHSQSHWQLHSVAVHWQLPVLQAQVQLSQVQFLQLHWVHWQVFWVSVVMVIPRYMRWWF